MKFSDIYGYSDLKDTLVNSVKSNHVAHALLFSGMSGSANLAMALAFAQYVNCESPTADDSCGSCASCVKFEKMIHPDLMTIFPSFNVAGKERERVKSAQQQSFREAVIKNPYMSYPDWVKSIDAEKKQCIISVEEGRSIAKNVSMKAFEAKYKVVLIWLPELMNQACANSILKILEEPPAKTLYLLVTSDFEKNITTILSRTQMVHVPLFDEKSIKSYLEDVHFVASKRAKEIAKYCDGSLRVAVKMINEEVDDSSASFVSWMRLCYKASLPELVDLADQFSKTPRAQQVGLLTYGLDINREIMLNTFSVDDLKRVSAEDAQFLDGFTKVFNEDKIIGFSEYLNEAIYHIERNLNAKILFMDLSLNLARLLRSK